MTKDEFEEYYARNSGFTVRGLHDDGIRAVRCDCGDEGCQGWQMMHDNTRRILERAGIL